MAVIFFYHSFLTIYCQSLCLAALSFSCYTNKFTLWPYIEHITTSYTIHQKIFKWVVNLILFNMSTNYCDTCQKSDCACIYSICLNHQPLDQMPVKKTRKTNSKKINWICCNFCKFWAHPKCTGLTNKEFKKINNTELKKNSSSFFFKCLKCSIKAVTSAGQNLPASKNTPTLTQEIST